MRGIAATALALVLTLCTTTFAFETGQEVTTGGGFRIKGKPSAWKPDVSEYLGIPYAQPPTGSLRFRPPQKFVPSNDTIQALKFSVDCPTNVPAYWKRWPLGSTAHMVMSALGQSGDSFGEDCLTANVWTKPQEGEQKKAVMLWIYGGGFGFGNSANPIYNGARLANDYDVVVVSLNYRLNIFGFPGLPGLSDQNLGLLDQRLAIEWVRDNIEAFGGDPARITLFGQSAGAISVDYYSYAYTADPIINGMISQSGTWELGEALSQGGNLSANWYKAARTVGCGGQEAGETTIECMQNKTWQEILLAIQREGSASALGNIRDFAPVADGKVVFNDYPTRARAGAFIKKPLLVGNNANELSLFLVAAGFSAQSVLGGGLVSGGNGAFDCPSGDAAKARADQGVKTWRYRFNGQFPNVDIKYAGSYHAGEIPFIFGTTEYTWDYYGRLYNRQMTIADTPAETQAVRMIMTAWTNFAKDPENGLDKIKWPTYNPNAATVIQIGGPNSATAQIITPGSVDTKCAQARAVFAKSKAGQASKTADSLESWSQPGSFIASIIPGLPTTWSLAQPVQTARRMVGDYVSTSLQRLRVR